MSVTGESNFTSGGAYDPLAAYVPDFPLGKQAMIIESVGTATQAQENGEDKPWFNIPLVIGALGTERSNGSRKTCKQRLSVGAIYHPKDNPDATRSRDFLLHGLMGSMGIINDPQPPLLPPAETNEYASEWRAYVEKEIVPLLPNLKFEGEVVQDGEFLNIRNIRPDKAVVEARRNAKKFRANGGNGTH